MRHRWAATVFGVAIVALSTAMACSNEADTSTDGTALPSDSPVATAEADTSEATPLSLADQIPPTATPTPLVSPTPVSESEREALQADITEEYLARCRVYVRNNEQPVTYADFLALDPGNMTDLERVIWAEEIGRREHCRDYWSEPLSATNAAKRNDSYRIGCYESLWDRHRQFIEQDSREGKYLQFDQASRIASWLDIPGDVLVAMNPKPLDLVLTVWEDRPSADSGARVEIDPESEWAGLVPGRIPDVGDVTGAWPSNPFEIGPMIGRAGTDDCVGYYPQLFIGHWIPLDTAVTRQEIIERLAIRTPTPEPDEMSTWISQRDRPVYVGE